GQRLRLLVAIASYGEKNLPFLRQVIQTYYGMDFDVRVVVFSNCPKDLDTEVDVVVGLPTKNPWSLPFAHKEFFRKHVENYDLFAYSEDDRGHGTKHPGVSAGYDCFGPSGNTWLSPHGTRPGWKNLDGLRSQTFPLGAGVHCLTRRPCCSGVHE